MRKFKQMTNNDRIKMEALINAGHSKAEIARQLHYHRSTIGREYRKGKYMHRTTEYMDIERYSSDLGQKAHDYAQEGKGKALKIGHDRKLAEYIEHKIVDDRFSPEAALAEVRRSGISFQTTISVRTLYRYIDTGIFLKLTNKELPIKSKKKNHYKKVRVQKRANAGESIENRPKDIQNRKTFGHWEMDTVKGQRGITKSCMLVLTERKTRNEMVIKLKDQTAASVVKALDRLEKKWGAMFYCVFKSITVDNGMEFANCKGMEKSALKKGKRTNIYYCHPYSSWERGTNENNNRLIRRHIPKGVNFDNKTNEDIAYIEKWINNYPRKIFKYRTSAELFQEELEKLG